MSLLCVFWALRDQFGCHALNLIDQGIRRPIFLIKDGEELSLLLNGKPDQIALIAKRNINHLILATAV